MTAIPTLNSLPPRQAALWRTAQYAGLGLTVLLLIGMVVEPELSLTILWNALIPLVPASLLISPLLWRNTCPLATLTMVANREKRPGLSPGAARYTLLAGVALLFLMVPARRFWFNTDGPLLAATVAAIAVAALALGAFFAVKVGFCNSICPVLPVERLYGQAPLLKVPNARCPTCTMCTARGCIDVAPDKSIPQTLGPARQDRTWLFSGYGVFAAAFPGFIIGYYTSADVALSQALAVYRHVALYAAISWAVVAAIVLLTRIRGRIAFVSLGAASAGLYYWFAPEAALGPMGVSPTGVTVARVVFLLLVTAWLYHALAKTGLSRQSAASSAR